MVCHWTPSEDLHVHAPMIDAIAIVEHDCLHRLQDLHLQESKYFLEDDAMYECDGLYNTHCH